MEVKIVKGERLLQAQFNTYCSGKGFLDGHGRGAWKEVLALTLVYTPRG
jgi:hypothetical protein